MQRLSSGAPLPSGAVAYALRRLLPDAGQTLLLCAALDAETGAAAWATWRASHDLPTTLASDRAGLKGLLPLLAFRLEQNGAAVSADDLSLLRMARYREQLRMARYTTILRQTLDALAAGGVQVILLKGAALTLTVYPAADLRHCHDIDLLVRSDEMAQAVTVLAAAGFGEVAPPPNRSAHPSPMTRDRTLQHSSGLPVVLHTRLFRDDFYAVPLDDVWRSAQDVGQGWPVRMLAPAWELVHIVGTMLCAPSQARVTWVCDAHFLLAAHPTLDWARVVEIARQCGLTLAMYATLAYLQQAHRAPVPVTTLETLHAQVAHGRHAAIQTDLEKLLSHARRQHAVHYGDLLAAATSWPERASLFRWMILPPLPATLRQDVRGWQLPLCYLRFYLGRGARFVRRRLVAVKPSRGHA